jgi:hypothetical protein
MALLFAAAPALADPIAPAALLPALDVYIDSVALGHAAAAACAPAKSPARDEGAWQKGKAVFVATLWANGFPIDFVRTASRRLDAAAGGAKPSCTDPAVVTALADPAQQGWEKAMQRPLAGADLKIVTQPVAPAVWQQIRTAIGKEAEAQKRLFDCVAVSEPELLPAVVHDWNRMIAEIGDSLMGTGLARDEVSSALSAADANALWHRTAPDAEAELRDSCAKDMSWQNRLNGLAFLGLKAQVAGLLPANPESGQ